MTNEEAEKLVSEATTRLRIDNISSSRMSAYGALCLLPLVLVPGAGVLFAFGSGLFAVTSALCYFAEISANPVSKKTDVAKTWDIISTTEFSAPPLPNATLLLRNSISNLYQQDVGTQTFPLVQAIRLLDSHQRQQERLQIVEHRLNELNALSGGMRVRLAKLRELGEDVPEAQRKLDQIERDEAALENIAAQISASCARLEAIFTGVQHAHQVRQLKRELGELSQVAGSATGSDLALEGDAFDIERQIGREIETFIRLERETDEHLRDV